MNKFICMGRLVADPELKTLQSGSTVCTFRVAVDRRLKNKDGERETDFFNCTAFGKMGEMIAKWFKKGRMIALDGRVQNRSWKDDKGVTHYATDIIAENVYFCGDGEKSDSSGAKKTTKKSEPAPEEGDGYAALEDDDVPWL